MMKMMIAKDCYVNIYKNLSSHETPVYSQSCVFFYIVDIILLLNFLFM